MSQHNLETLAIKHWVFYTIIDSLRYKKQDFFLNDEFYDVLYALMIFEMTTPFMRVI